MLLSYHCTYITNSKLYLYSYHVTELKDKRRIVEQQRERDSSFLRIGSLNVKVKSTTKEAFGYFLGKSHSSSSFDKMMQKRWGSAENLPENQITNHQVITLQKFHSRILGRLRMQIKSCINYCNDCTLDTR